MNGIQKNNRKRKTIGHFKVKPNLYKDLYQQLPKHLVEIVKEFLQMMNDYDMRIEFKEVEFDYRWTDTLKGFAVRINGLVHVKTGITNSYELWWELSKAKYHEFQKDNHELEGNPYAPTINELQTKIEKLIENPTTDIISYIELDTMFDTYNMLRYYWDVEFAKLKWVIAGKIANAGPGKDFTEKYHENKIKYKNMILKCVVKVQKIQFNPNEFIGKNRSLMEFL